MIDDLQKVVTPANPGSASGTGAGVQCVCPHMKFLDTGFRRYDACRGFVRERFDSFAQGTFIREKRR